MNFKYGDMVIIKDPTSFYDAQTGAVVEKLIDRKYNEIRTYYVVKLSLGHETIVAECYLEGVVILDRERIKEGK